MTVKADNRNTSIGCAQACCLSIVIERGPRMNKVGTGIPNYNMLGVGCKSVCLYECRVYTVATCTVLRDTFSFGVC